MTTARMLMLMTMMMISLGSETAVLRQNLSQAGLGLGLSFGNFGLVSITG